jgi:protein-tyrosine phosphatase
VVVEQLRVEPSRAVTATRQVRPWAALLAVAFVGFMVVGNLVLLGTSVALQVVGPDGTSPAGVTGIDHARIVDDKVWRGGAPSEAGYEFLLANGVTTVVDLRAGTSFEELESVRALGFSVVHLPVNDGEAPPEASIDKLMEVVAASSGKVFIHCQAGVGRTGSVVAAYEVRTGTSSGVGAAVANLAIGPPTLEQLAYTVNLEGSSAARPPAPIVMASRVLDAPRQIWNRLFG